MTFQILCVTMNQSGFEKIEEMNIHSDVIFSNQANENSYRECVYDSVHIARMITTTTRGVGINRNIGLCYADADIVLFSDDDLVYFDGLESAVISEFKANGNADIIIFHLESNDKRRQLKKYKKTRKAYRFERHPWGAVRIAAKLSSIKKANLWFSSLFGGGSKYLSGEDSMWIDEAYRAGLAVHVSDITIGKVDMGTSTWFSGYNEQYFYSKGALFKANNPKAYLLWILYFAIRTTGLTELSIFKRIMWMNYGIEGYRKYLSFDEFMSIHRK